MLENTREILYLFDFDGTLFGDNQWYGYFKNLKSCLKNGPYIVPSKKNIKWNILTGRPRIDYYLIKIICNMNGLYPEKIITTDTIFHKFENDEEGNKWKSDIIKKILDDDDKYKYVEKVIYIDADVSVATYINNIKGNYNYYAVSLINFIKEQFIYF